MWLDAVIGTFKSTCLPRNIPSTERSIMHPIDTAISNIACNIPKKCNFDV
jgi:hypothetical protein